MKQYETKSLQDDCWVHFVLALYCWAQGLDLRGKEDGWLQGNSVSQQQDDACMTAARTQPAQAQVGWGRRMMRGKCHGLPPITAEPSPTDIRCKGKNHVSPVPFLLHSLQLSLHRWNMVVTREAIWLNHTRSRSSRRPAPHVVHSNRYCQRWIICKWSFSFNASVNWLEAFNRRKNVEAGHG